MKWFSLFQMLTGYSNNLCKLVEGEGNDDFKPTEFQELLLFNGATVIISRLKK